MEFLSHTTATVGSWPNYNTYNAFNHLVIRADFEIYLMLLPEENCFNVYATVFYYIYIYIVCIIIKIRIADESAVWCDEMSTTKCFWWMKHQHQNQQQHNFIHTIEHTIIFSLRLFFFFGLLMCRTHKVVSIFYINVYNTKLRDELLYNLAVYSTTECAIEIGHRRFIIAIANNVYLFRQAWLYISEACYTWIWAESISNEMRFGNVLKLNDVCVRLSATRSLFKLAANAKIFDGSRVIERKKKNV